MAVYEQKESPPGSMSFALTERHIYGSSRLGVNNLEVELISPVTVSLTSTSRLLGRKNYEISNHLGNVLTVVSDIIIPEDNNTDGEVDGYYADVVSATDYSAFGVTLYGRTWSGSDYRYGFNGMEKDDEVKGSGNSLDFNARIYDSRLGKFLSIDPLYGKYASQSPYNAFNSNPLIYNDPTGKGGELTITKNSEGAYVATVNMTIYLYSDQATEAQMQEVQDKLCGFAISNEQTVKVISPSGEPIQVPLTIQLNVQISSPAEVAEKMKEENQADNFFYVRPTEGTGLTGGGYANGNSGFLNTLAPAESMMEEILHTLDPRFEEDLTNGAPTIGGHNPDPNSLLYAGGNKPGANLTKEDAAALNNRNPLNNYGRNNQRGYVGREGGKPVRFGSGVNNQMYNSNSDFENQPEATDHPDGTQP